LDEPAKKGTVGVLICRPVRHTGCGLCHGQNLDVFCR